MTTTCKDISCLSKSDLEVARYLVHNMLERLIPGGKICKRDGAVVLLRKALDDTGFREVQMFKVLRTTLGSQIDKTVKGGPAIAKFVNNGIKIQGGKTLQYNAALKELHASLEKSLGPEVARRTAKDVAKVIEKQWVATKAIMAKSAAKAKRAVSRGITKVDQGTLKVLNGQNNFFISGFYNTAAVNKVNSTIAGAVKQGIPKREMGPMLRATLPAQIASRGDAYYQILANDVLQRARSFAQVNAFVEARIRRYEIFAVIDERTTEICEYMDGRVFDVEIARKIVKDITRIGIPGNDKEAQQLKAFRPWLQFNKGKALDGKNALFFRDAKGKKVYLPDSGFSVDKAGKFSPTGAKTRQTSREIVDATPRNSNPPQLPPFHGRCRTTFSADEEDIQTQNWTAGLTDDILGVGTQLVNSSTGAQSVVRGVAHVGGRTRLTMKDTLAGKEKTEDIFMADFARTRGVNTRQKASKKPASSAKKVKPGKSNPTVKKLEKTIFPHGAAEEAYTKEVINASKAMPENTLKGIRSLTISDELVKDKLGVIDGEYRFGSKIIYLYMKESKARRATKKRVVQSFHHEVGHHVFDNKSGVKFSKALQNKWIDFDFDQLEKGARLISTYADEDEVEHFCEVFAYWFTNPSMLKKKEPAAYAFFKKNIVPVLKKK